MRGLIGPLIKPLAMNYSEKGRSGMIQFDRFWYSSGTADQFSGFRHGPRSDLPCSGFPALAFVSLLVGVLVLSKYLSFAKRS